MPEIEIKIKVNICSRCHHLWQRRKGIEDAIPITCPNCNSPYWNTVRTRGLQRSEKRKKLPPLRFHGEEILDSNIEEVLGLIYSPGVRSD
jgi:hypothetical protein